ncbi:hypothetical protein EMCRGX_G017898 [Ephydatia muelleri]|eukprot:Em0012g335a
MVMHARSGGKLEVMGLMLGKTDGPSMVVMDTFALPVEGTETRVNAQAAAYEYMSTYIETAKKVRKPVDTRGAVVGEYELRKFAREEEEKRKATEAKAIYESSVICDVLETRPTEYHRSSVPVIKSIVNVRKKWNGTLGRWLMSIKKFTLQNKFMLATL